MEIISINTASFEDEVLKSDIPVLVDFNADWCGPCKMLKPILEEIASSLENFKIVSVNIDDEEDLSMEYDVSAIPCLVLFKDGKEINRSVGLKSKDDIEKMIGV